MISPAVHFDPVPLRKEDMPNIVGVRPPVDTNFLDAFLPKDAVLQASGFLSEHMTKLITDQNKGQENSVGGPSNAMGPTIAISDTDSVISQAESDISGITANTPRSGVTTPRGGPGASTKPFSSSVVSFAAPPNKAAALKASFEVSTPKSGNSFSSFPENAFETSTDGATAPPTTSGGFDDMFAGFSNKPPVVPAESVLTRPATLVKVRSDVTAAMQDEVLCIYKAGKIEKFDYFGMLTISLSNDSFPDGVVKVDIHDPSVQVTSCVVHPSVQPKGKSAAAADDTAPVAQKTLELMIPASKKAFPAVKLPYVRSLRPILFQVKIDTRWESNIVNVTIRIKMNPQFKQHIIDSFTVSLSLAGLLIPGTSTVATVAGVQTKPTGTYINSSNVVGWTTARFNPAKQPEVVLEAAVKCADDVDVSADSVDTGKQLPIILKGKYSNSLMSGVDCNVLSVGYNSETEASAICRDFDLNFSKLKRSKFEYRFM